MTPTFTIYFPTSYDKQQVDTWLIVEGIEVYWHRIGVYYIVGNYLGQWTAEVVL